MFELIPSKRGGSWPDFAREIERLTRRFWEDMSLTESGMEIESQWLPRLDLVETPEGYEVKAELPGLEKKELDISLSQGNLIIRGEKKQEEKKSGKHYHRLERRYGSFYRSIPLPGEVLEDKISASFKDGVLTITLPKSEIAKKKLTKIDVK